MKKIIFFSIDRLGDYLIRSNVIKKISDNFDFSEIICSEKNYKLISSQKYLNKVVLFNTKNKIINKIKFLINYFLKTYDSAIVFDGKNISTLLLFFVKAKFKFAFIYRKKGLSNIIFTKIFIFFLKIFNINYEFLNSRDLIINNDNKNYPDLYKNLKIYFKNIEKKTYYIEESNILNYNKFFERYILIHLDEKYNDIIDINNNFTKSLNEFKSYINKKIILTSYKNDFKYYKNLDLKKIHFNEFNHNMNLHNENFIVENLPLDHFQNLIKNSYVNISCHSGLLVHMSLAMNKKTIDIINKNDEIWYNNWISSNNNYKKIFKSNVVEQKTINQILSQIMYEIRKY